MTKSSQTNRGPRFLTIKETADLLNYDERTIRRWISSGALEAHRPGREWRIAREALDEFLALSSNRRFSSVLYVLLCRDNPSCRESVSVAFGFECTDPVSRMSAPGASCPPDDLCGFPTRPQVTEGDDQ